MLYDWYCVQLKGIILRTAERTRTSLRIYSRFDRKRPEYRWTWPRAPRSSRRSATGSEPRWSEARRAPSTWRNGTPIWGPAGRRRTRLCISSGGWTPITAPQCCRDRLRRSWQLWLCNSPRRCELWIEKKKHLQRPRGVEEPSIVAWYIVVRTSVRKW